MHYEVEVDWADTLKTFLYHMIAILVNYALYNMAVQFPDNPDLDNNGIGERININLCILKEKTALVLLTNKIF